jgi:hypothetical protein
MTRFLMLACAATMLFAGTAYGDILMGSVQRYQADDYGATSAGVWDDSAGSADATAVGTFVTTTTPNGSIGIENAGAGEQMNFSGAANLNGGFTIQAVIQIQNNGDRRQGPFGLDQSTGWGGLYMGARSNGNVETRGGTQTPGSNAGLLSTNGTPTVAAGTWGILTLIGDVTNTSAQLTYSFDLEDGTNVWSFTDVGDGSTNSIAGIGTAGRLFGGETGGGEPATDEWLGAIADLVVYDSVLTAAEIANNRSEFNTLYFTSVPEPTTGLILLPLGAMALSRRKRR